MRGGSDDWQQPLCSGSLMLAATAQHWPGHGGHVGGETMVLAGKVRAEQSEERPHDTWRWLILSPGISSKPDPADCTPSSASAMFHCSWRKIINSSCLPEKMFCLLMWYQLKCWFYKVNISHHIPLPQSPSIAISHSNKSPRRSLQTFKLNFIWWVAFTSFNQTNPLVMDPWVFYNQVVELIGQNLSISMMQNYFVNQFFRKILFVRLFSSSNEVLRIKFTDIR